MKRYICWIMLLGLLACQEDDLVWYSQEKDAIQFWVDDESTEAAGMTLEFNFATATYSQVVSGEEQTFYYGDSLTSYTFEKIMLELQGFPTPDERPYRLKTVLVEGQDSSKVGEVIFGSYHSLAPNQLRDTIQLTILRPKARGTYTIGVMIDTTGSDAFFEKGVVERSVLRLNIKDVYEEPSDWKYRTEWLGAFSEEKYAFMVSVSQMVFSRNNNSMWNHTDDYNALLRTALATFNAAHPGEEKTFTFPVTTKPIWWDNQKHLLGEFSEEKHVFMKDLYGGALKQNDMEYWNLMFRDELEATGRTDIEVPRNETMSSWWRASAVGDWSVDKQEFVIRNLFPISYYQITDATWDYANVILRDILTQYNATHPGGELAFTFPVEGVPSWWEQHSYDLGDYMPAKRDIVVQYVFEDNAMWGDYNINQLINTYYPMSNYMNDFRRLAEEYNAAHPGEDPVTFPVVAPQWWDDQSQYLGDWSVEKEDFMKQVIASFDGYYNEWVNWVNWNPIFRYELAAYNATHPENPYTFEFPVVDGTLSYWSELPYLGEYSETKKVFVWMTLLPLNWGSVDGWTLGAPSEGGSSDVWPNRHAALMNAYNNGGYEAFMAKYAAANPEAFSFPATW